MKCQAAVLRASARIGRSATSPLRRDEFAGEHSDAAVDVSERQLKLDELVTRRYRLDEINDAIADMRDGRNIRGVIEFD